MACVHEPNKQHFFVTLFLVAEPRGDKQEPHLLGGFLGPIAEGAMPTYDPSSSNNDEFIAKKNEARNWPWVVQEWECFKTIKSIHNGPCELIPESFLRDSLSRHHKSDP
jgi:hypothetical protein